MCVADCVRSEMCGRSEGRFGEWPTYNGTILGSRELALP